MTPELPRLRAGLFGRPVGDGYIVDGLVIDGGPRRERFAGRLAWELFPVLLPLLDGTRSVEEISVAVAMPVPRLLGVLDVLCRRQLVEFANRDPDSLYPGGPDNPLDTFFDRTMPPLRRAAVRRRIGAARVLIAGDDPLVELCTGILRESGIDTQPMTPLWTGDGFDLLISIQSAGSSGDTPTFPDGGPRLPVWIDVGRITIGPLRGVAGGPCRQCADAALGRSPFRPGSARDDLGTGPPNLTSDSATQTALRLVAAGLLAGAALRTVGGYGESRIAPGIIEVRPHGDVREHPVHRRPGCANCGRPELRLTEAARTAYAGELSVDGSPYGPDHGIDPVAASVPRPAKRYLTEPRHPLTDGHLGVSRLSADRLDTDYLAGSSLRWMLERALGVSTRRSRHRATVAPSSRPPGTIRAYLVGPDRPPRYVDPVAGELVELAVPPGSRPGGSPLSLILTGALAATGNDARERRLVAQDSGLVVAYLYTLATVAGWHVRGRDPNDGLARMLDLDAATEMPIAIVDLTPAALPMAARSRRQRTARLLANLPVAYGFGDAPIERDDVTRIVGAALADSAAAWPMYRHGAVPMRCVVYPRNVTGLPRGVYEYTADRWVESNLDPTTLDRYLDERGMNPAALILCTGDLEAAMATAGPGAYSGMLARAATTGGLLWSAASRAGLAAGLYARLPATMLSSPTERLLFATAIGPGAPTEPNRTVIW
jgi:bacteriocin biosynthesis cyclodehydratase domain-containing protein